MSAVATAGAAAWVVPEILTAKPAAGATVSTRGGGGGTGGSPGTPGTPGTTGTNGTDGTNGTNGTSGTNAVATNPASTTPANLASAGAPAATPASTLAFTGLNIQRDAEIGAALIAGGWAMHHWASRAPKPAAEAHDAGNSDQPT